MSYQTGATAVLTATLQRSDNSSWGFRLRGGTDFQTPVTIERVIHGSLADRCGLRPGDIINGISGVSAANMRHEDAHEAVVRAGNVLKLEIHRQTFDSTTRFDDDTSSAGTWNRSIPTSRSGSRLTGQEAGSSTFDSYDARRIEVNPKVGSKLMEPVIDEMRAIKLSDETSQQYNSNKPEPSFSQPAWSNRRHSTQSRTFLLLQSMLDGGEETTKVERPVYRFDRPNADAFPGTSRKENELGTEEFRESGEYLRSSSRNSDSGSGTTTPRNQPPAFIGRQENLVAPPFVPVPRRSPAPRPPPAGPLTGQPRAFRPGAAIRNSTTNPASRIPVCYRCSRNIRGPFIVALDKTFCPEHFVCDKCGTDMVELGFVETPDGKIFCEEDYGRYMAPRCHRCRQAIIGTIVKALSAEWHTDCFTCAHCGKSIAGGMFHVEDGKPYCEKDYAQLFQTKCKGCDFPIEAGDRWIEAAGENYHATCFACTTCQCSLANRGFVMKNGKPYCTPHSRGK